MGMSGEIPSTGPIGRLFRFFWRTRLVIVVFGFLVGLSIAGYYYSSSTILTHGEQLFDRNTDSIADAVSRHVKEHIDLLKGLDALYRSSVSVERDEFNKFVENYYRNRFDETAIIGFARRVKRSQRNAFVSRVNTEIVGGQQGVTIFPDQGQDEFFVYDYIYPQSFSWRRIGFDIGSDAVIRQAISKARETGEPTATEFIRAPTGDRDNEIMYMFYPVYENNLPTSTAAERSMALTGFLCLEFSAIDLVQHSFPKELFPDIAVEASAPSVRDGARGIHKLSLIESKLNSPVGRTKDFAIDVLGIPITLRFTHYPHIDMSPVEHILPTMILIGGILIAFLTAGIMLVLLLGKERALRLAESLSAETFRSEEKYRMLISNIPDIIWTADEQSKPYYLSPSITRIYGFTPEEVMAAGDKLWIDRIHKDDVDAVAEAHKRLYAEDAPIDMTFRIKRRDGEWIWIHNRSTKPYWRDGKRFADGVFTDVTEIRKSEELLHARAKQLELANTSLDHTRRELLGVMGDLEVEKIKIQKEEAKDRAIIESIGDGVLFIDRDGTILMANPAAGSLLGTEMGALVGKTMEDAIMATDESGSPIAPDQRLYQIVLKTGQPMRLTSATSKYYYGKSDGKRFPVGVTVTPVYIGGKITGVIEVFRDVSREKEIDRMKTEFLSVAAHQLRTPLGSMRWNMEMILKGFVGPVSDKVADVIRQLYASDLRIISLVNNLLDVSRIDQNRTEDVPELTDVTAVIQAAVTEVEPESKRRNVTVHVDIDPRVIPKIVIDQRKFREVIQNLITNAIKYNSKDGSVYISAVRGEGTLRISVRDTGVGIADKDKDRIFSKFFRGANAVKIDTEGTGLGLFVVKSYVEGWGGNIWFESVENKGTTFFVEIPMVVQSASKQEG